MQDDGKCIHYFADLDNVTDASLLTQEEEEGDILQIIVFCNRYHHITSHHITDTSSHLQSPPTWPLLLVDISI